MSIYELIVILGASKARWTSAVYDHYETSLRCHTKGDGSPEYLEFDFTCRTDPANHRPHHRKREQTGQGTKNLNRGLIVDRVCCAAHQRLILQARSQYWENACVTRPRLAQMALDFLSAPGM
jgi:hypothetical protein